MVEPRTALSQLAEFDVGEVLGGVLELACPGSEPPAPGDEVFFQFWPGEGSTTLANRTGRCAALFQRDGVVSFHFAGENREATVTELRAASCWQEHDAWQTAFEERTGANVPANLASDEPGAALTMEQAAVTPVGQPNPAECSYDE